MKADEDLNALFEKGVLNAYGTDLGPEIYRTYLELFQALPVMIRTTNHVLICHSLPSARSLPTFDPIRIELDAYAEEDLQPGGTIHSLLWGRDTSSPTPRPF